MKLPDLDAPQKYVGLYVVDFGEHTGVGFTADEVAELLDSERYRHCRVYKIHRAYPDGRLEIKGVQAQTFQLESGMIFHAADEPTARNQFKSLVNLGIREAPPCRAKVHLARYPSDGFSIALIYPAEYEDEIGRWLLEGEYRTAGPAEGGTGAVQRYYDQQPEIMDRHQLFASGQQTSRTGVELLAGLTRIVQR